KVFIRSLCVAQQELAAKAAKPVREFPLFLDYQEDAYGIVEAAASERLAEVMSIAAKTEREERTEQLLGEVVEELAAEGKQLEGREKEVSGAFRALTKQVVRKKVLTDGVRIDGRGLRDIRALSAEVEVLPRVHGRSEEHTSELQSRENLVCRLLLEKKKK